LSSVRRFSPAPRLTAAFRTRSARGLRLSFDAIFPFEFLARPPWQADLFRLAPTAPMTRDPW
jgi:hypothetical protein